jgi:hypothetical protein
MKILEPLESLLNRMQSHELQDTNDSAEREAPKRGGVGPIIRRRFGKAGKSKGVRSGCQSYKFTSIMQ